MNIITIVVIVITPWLASVLEPVFTFVWKYLHIEPSVVPAMLFANDMGGAPLATEIAVNEQIGGFNALIMSSMMGVTISFTIPFALGVVKFEQHKELFLGVLCGIVAIPLGCLVSGLITVGLVIGMIHFLTGKEIVTSISTLEEGAWFV